MKGKILQLESLRGVAALLVTIYHANFIKDLYLTENNFFRHGYLMVDLFFVLSGFVISYNYAHRFFDFDSLFAFQKRRFFRLYPLHFVTLMIFIIIGWVKDPVSGGLTESGYKIFHNIFLTQSLFLKNDSFNHVSWSISTEFYTYLIYGLLILSFKDRGFFHRMVVGLVIALGLSLYFLDAGQATTGLALIRCLYSFLLGSSIWHFCQHQTKRLPQWMVGSVVIGSVVCVCFGGLIPDQLFPLLFAALVYSLVWMPEGRLKKIMVQPTLVWLGTLSYSVYMWHYLVWWLMRNVSLRMPFMEVFTNEYGKKLLVLSQFQGSLYILLGLAIILMISFLSYNFIELRFLQNKKKLLSKNSAKD